MPLACKLTYSIAKAAWALNEQEFSGIMTNILTANLSNSRQMNVLVETIQNIYGVISNIKTPRSGKRLATYQEFRQKIEDIIERETGRRPAATMRYKAAAPIPSAIPTDRNKTIQKTDNGDELGWNITFGNISSHPRVSKAVVFVSTYHITNPALTTGIIIRLNDSDDRNRYIVIENPNFDPGNESYA